MKWDERWLRHNSNDVKGFLLELSAAYTLHRLLNSLHDAFPHLELRWLVCASAVDGILVVRDAISPFVD